MTKKVNTKIHPRFVCLCDYAFITSDNKLSIIGEFDRLMSGGEGEMVLSQAYLVGSFDIEGKTQNRLIVKFLNEKGEEFSQSKVLTFHESVGERANFIIKLVNINFPKFGRYFICFFDEKDNELIKTKIDFVSYPPTVQA